ALPRLIRCLVQSPITRELSGTIAFPADSEATVVQTCSDEEAGGCGCRGSFIAFKAAAINSLIFCSEAPSGIVKLKRACLISFHALSISLNLAAAASRSPGLRSG